MLPQTVHTCSATCGECPFARDRSLATERTLAQLEAIRQLTEAVVESVAIAIACTPQRKQPYAINCTSVIPLRRRPDRDRRSYCPKPRQAPTPRAPKTRTPHRLRRSPQTANCWQREVRA